MAAKSSRKSAARKSAPKKGAARKTPAPQVARATTPKKAAGGKGAAGKLHYNKDKLHAEYTRTYRQYLIGGAVVLGVVLIYFIVFIVFLGSHGHTPYNDFVRDFGDRIEIDYDGLKVPPPPAEPGE